MAFYQIEWTRSATKDLRKLPQKNIDRIVKLVDALAENPLPIGAKKLTAEKPAYRIREGVYRVIYTISARLLVIEVVKAGHRKDVYQ